MAKKNLFILIALCSVIYLNYEVKADCGGLIEDSVGYITSPLFPSPYPPNQDCIWEIRTTPDKHIGISFMNFSLEAHNSCIYDFVTIRSKMEDGSFIEHGKYCGNRIIRNFVSKKNILLIKFKSDGGTQEKGFKIVYLSVDPKCGGSIMTNKTKFFYARIESPLYPFDYPPHTNCTWNIQVPVNLNIRVEFDRLRIGESSQCDLDYVSIQSKMADGKIIEHGKFCGTEFPPQIYSESNTVLVHLVSNSGLQYQGFKMDIHIEECGGTILGFGSVIKSPFYPHLYPSNKICQWTILSVPQYKSKLKFHHFEIEEGGDDCSNDFLLIQRKTKEGEIQEYGKYCGNSTPPSISSKDDLVLTFVSDRSSSEKGFKASYRIVKLSDYEMSTSLIKPTTVDLLNKPTTESQYENKEEEYIHSLNETNSLKEDVKLLGEKISSMENNLKILLDNYETLLKTNKLLTSKFYFLKEEEENDSN